jgi:hypothetical protein
MWRRLSGILMQLLHCHLKTTPVELPRPQSLFSNSSHSSTVLGFMCVRKRLSCLLCVCEYKDERNKALSSCKHISAKLMVRAFAKALNRVNKIWRPVRLTWLLKAGVHRMDAPAMSSMLYKSCILYTSKVAPLVDEWQIIKKRCVGKKGGFCTPLRAKYWLW